MDLINSSYQSQLKKLEKKIENISKQIMANERNQAFFAQSKDTNQKRADKLKLEMDKVMIKYVGHLKFRMIERDPVIAKLAIQWSAMVRSHYSADKYLTKVKEEDKNLRKMLLIYQKQLMLCRKSKRTLCQFFNVTEK